METFGLIATLMVAVVVLVSLADRIGIPYPMLLMVGGLALAVAPGMPTVELEPEIVLIIFLPPILFQAAQTTSIRDFKANFRVISRLAFGLVIATTLLVAVVAHWIIPGMTWPAAFVLGAVVSPPDAVAATAIFQRLGAPRRIVTILEGESLINDASAIVVYTFAVAAVVTGTFSMTDALMEFVVVVVVGVLVGFLVARILGRVLSIIGDPSLIAVVTLVVPSAAYVLAERIGGSGVLAVVVAGLGHGYASSRTMTATARFRSNGLWELVTIVLNGFVFILIGFELGALTDDLTLQGAWQVLWHGIVVLAALMAARFIYIFVGYKFRRHKSRRHDRVFNEVDPRGQVLIAWSGLRGIVSLATALALPYVTDSGAQFTQRDEIVLITAVVIVFSLFGLGLPLPWILRKLNLQDDGAYDRELRMARQVVGQAMHDRLSGMLGEDPELEKFLSPMLRELQANVNRGPAGIDAKTTEEMQEFMRPRMLARRSAIDTARATLLELRDLGQIGDEVRRDMERELDLQDLQFNGGV